MVFLSHTTSRSIRFMNTPYAFGGVEYRSVSNRVKSSRKMITVERTRQLENPKKGDLCDV